MFGLRLSPRRDPDGEPPSGNGVGIRNRAAETNVECSPNQALESRIQQRRSGMVILMVDEWRWDEAMNWQLPHRRFRVVLGCEMNFGEEPEFERQQSNDKDIFPSAI